MEAARGKHSYHTLKLPLSLGVVEVQSIVATGRHGCVLVSGVEGDQKYQVSLGKQN